MMLIYQLHTLTRPIFQILSPTPIGLLLPTLSTLATPWACISATASCSASIRTAPTMYVVSAGNRNLDFLEFACPVGRNNRIGEIWIFVIIARLARSWFVDTNGSGQRAVRNLLRFPSPPTTFMFYIYVIKSKKDDKLYIGFTNDLRKRLIQHNQGLNKSTKYRIPFVLVYYETYLSEKDARIRERRLKRFKNSYTELKKRIKHSLDRT